MRVYIDDRIETENGFIHFKLDKIFMVEKIMVEGLKLNLARE